MKKYLVIEDTIVSKHDNDTHFIDANQLIKLYGVKRSECIIVKLGQNVRNVNVGNLIILKPRYNGDYNEFRKKFIEN